MEKLDLTKRFFMYFVGLISLREKDIWLPSFPRAGSTWVRFLLCNLISLTELNGQVVDYEVVAKIMPALGSSNLQKSWNFKSTPRFIKTHQTYRRFLFDIPQKVAYIIRDPRDIMVSYFHYRKARLKNPFQGNFSEFIRHPNFGLHACIHHYITWCPHITYSISYEKLKIDTFTELQRIIKIFGLDIPEKHIKNAYQRSSFEEIKPFAEQWSRSRGASHDKFIPARKGQVNQWPTYFTDEDLFLYSQICREMNYDLYIHQD